MRTVIYRHFLIILSSLLFSGSLLSQMERPRNIEHPEFDVDRRVMKLRKGLDYATEKISEGRNVLDEEWTVFADRDGVQYYKDKKLTKLIGPVGQLGVKLVVHNETDESFEVYRDGVELGWVRKSEFVVWNRPLVKAGTAVDVKAFIVNRMDRQLIEEIGENPEVKDIYQIYGSPFSKTVLNKNSIYQIMFAYKYDESSKRYLLSGSSRLTDSDQLLGWVKEHKIKVWDTSIALEPNWDPNSIAEREVDELLQAQVFTDLASATAHRGGKDVKNLLSMDPAAQQGEEFDELIFDGRYAGDVPRFPFFHEIPGTGIIECGAIGKMNVANLGNTVRGTNDNRYARLRMKLQKREEGQYATNVIFLLDGTRGMNYHAKETIPQAVDAIKAQLASDPDRANKLKFGLLVYGDGECATPGSELILNKIPLTDDFKLFKDKTRATEADVKDPGSYYPAMRFGLKTAAEGLGFKEFENNIIVHIGRSADVGADLFSSECDGAMMVDDEDLFGALFNFRPALISIQSSWRSDEDAFYDFEENNLELMIETAKYINESEHEKHDLVKEGVSIDVEPKEMSGYTDVTNSPSLMRVYLPNRKLDISKIERDELQTVISSSFKACLDRSEEELRMVRMLYHDNGTMGKVISDYSSLISSPIFQDIPKEAMKLLGSERVHFFSNANTYLKHENANYPTYRYVLFLKSSNVEALRKFFNSIEDASDSADDEGKKDYLRNALEQYARTMLNIQDVDEVNIDLKNLREQILGFSGDLGFATEGNLLSRLSNWEEVDDLSSQEVKQLFADLIEKGREFEQAVYPKGGYRFTYHAGLGDPNAEPELKFYWIPIEFLF
jgi:hypothetical protein